MDQRAKDILVFQTRRGIVNLYKNFLTLLEDLYQDHQAWKRNGGSKDYLDQEKCAYLRKKVLDKGNETLRELEDHFNNFEVDFRME